MPETGSTSGGRTGSGQPPAGLGSEVDSAVVSSSAAAEVEGHKEPDLLETKGNI